MNNKILVAYFTKGGASEEYANVISEALRSKGHAIETHNLANKIPDITDFETVILGTGVRMYQVYSRWKKVLKQNQSKINICIYFSQVEWLLRNQTKLLKSSYIH